jgi:serine/threonine protein kinase/beta-lactam-binding protein with PASTA domain
VTRTDTNLVGTLLERRYRVDRLLARGGMSSVYRGLDTRLDRQVAIKIMDPRFADDLEFVERFEREARSAARLHHPHVVAVHDQGVDTTYGEEATRAFLIMELVDGGTLRDLMYEQGPLDVALALSVVEPVLSALAAAHNAGLIHRDVKPENVLIGRGGTIGAGGVVKVADFGLVRAVASAGTSSANTILGTVAYLSPEQVTTGMTTARGDVYSTGILLYEMLTGRAPYTGDTAISVAYRHVNDDVPRPSELRPGLPPALDELILRATRRDPLARPEDAGVFLAELNQLRAALAIPAVTIPVPPPPDGDRVSDVERTMPGVSGGPAMTAIPRSAAEATMVMSGPRGTMALNRDMTMGAPPPSPPAGMPTQNPPRRRSAPPPEKVTGLKALNGLSRRNRWIALAAAVVLLGALIGTGAYLLTPSGGVSTVEIPSVAGESQADAGTALRNLKLVPKFTKEQSNTVASSQVIRTDPPEGTTLNPGDAVTVVISSGRPVVPEIQAGTSVGEAEKVIREAGLEPSRAPDAFSPDVPLGAVLSVDPSPGSPVDIGGQVTITLSKGPAPLLVPDVVGKTKDDAFKILQGAGFQPVMVQDNNPGAPPNTVTRTDPQANAQVPAASKRINVFVAGDQQVTVPDVKFKQFDEARQILTDQGFQVDIKGGHGRGGGGGGGFDFVLSQNPAAGTKVDKGSKVELKGIG